ncbi:MAG: insulinase family protein [Bacilli bacterium]|nr:insulinase family protein [Bacilli bacterium]
MLKHDFGHLGCPFYEEVLDNGMTVVFIPSKSKLKSATIYVAQGGFLHSQQISTSKIPFGSAYYLMNMVLSNSLVESLKKDGVLASSSLDYSYVRYSLNTLGDLYTPLKKVMNRVAKPCFEEKDIEAFKETERILASQREKDALEVSKRGCLDNLYLSSPIKYGYIPSFEDGIRIHASALKKYQETYYTPSNVVLFIASDDTPEKVLEEVKKLPQPHASSLEEQPFTYDEIYTEVNKEFTKKSLSSPHSYLTYGIKMPARANIYEKYGDLAFAFYQILLRSIVLENDFFKDNLTNLRATLVSTSFKEGGEDSYILLSFQTEDEVSLINFLTNYFARLDNRVTTADFKRIQEETYAWAIKELALPNQAVDAFSKTYANHIPYTSLVNRVSRLTYNVYRRFLEEFKTFKKAVCFVKKGNVL